MSDKKIRNYPVTGFAVVPVKVRIEIEAVNAEAAMKSANIRLKTGTGICKHIVAGSDDEGAAWGFIAFNADELK